MANPSLQIGNDNWAIKEDNLLGYSTAGTRFVPQTITMTRATLGTRVNPSGLVEDVELLGSELTSPLNFLSTWLQASVDSKTYNTFTVGGSGRGMYFMLPENKTLKINVSGVTGSVQLRYRTTTGGAGTVLGDFDTDLYLTTTNATTNIYLRATGAGTVSVTDVSVKEATIENLPRVDYTDGTSSLLVEPQRTNTVTYSEDFSQFSTSGSPTLTTGQLAPDGTLSATKVSGTIGSTYLALSGTTSATATRTIYAKTVSGTGTARLMSYFGNTDNLFNLTEEWQRFELTGAISTGAANFYVDMRGTQTLSEFIVWGGQSEEATYATSYIKTSGSTVTRNQETYTKTGISDKIGQTEGTFFIELSKPVLEPDSYYLISLNNAASNSDDNSVTIGFDNGSDDFYIRLRANASSTFTDNNRASLANTFYKIAIAYKSGQSLIYIDGNPITPSSGNLSTAFTFSATLDNLSFDYNGNNSLPFYGKVKQLQIFKTALSDSELATLTT